MYSNKIHSNKIIAHIPNSVVLFFIILIGSCHHSKLNNDEDKSYSTIRIQPFVGISNEQRDYVFNELVKIYPCVELKKAIKLPPSAYSPKRNRYRADSLILYLTEHTPEGQITIGLTNKDISITKDSIKNWGVTGFSFCPGRACVVSSFRLSKKARLVQLFKVSIHELGHTQGLKHCPVKTCFMRDAGGRNTTSEEKEFCQTCKSYLIDKGWRFQSR